MSNPLADLSNVHLDWTSIASLEYEIALQLAWDEDRARDLAAWVQIMMHRELSEQRKKIEAILQSLMKEPQRITRNSALATVAVVLTALDAAERRQLGLVEK